MRYKIEKNEIHPTHFKEGLILAAIAVFVSMGVFLIIAFLIAKVFFS